MTCIPPQNFTNIVSPIDSSCISIVTDDICNTECIIIGYQNYLTKMNAQGNCVIDSSVIDVGPSGGNGYPIPVEFLDGCIQLDSNNLRNSFVTMTAMTDPLGWRLDINQDTHMLYEWNDPLGFAQAIFYMDGSGDGFNCEIDMPLDDNENSAIILDDDNVGQTGFLMCGAQAYGGIVVDLGTPPAEVIDGIFNVVTDVVCDDNGELIVSKQVWTILNNCISAIEDV